MKSNIFTKGLAAVLVAGSLASCSSDYLDLEPITTVASTQLADDVNSAQTALNGICKAMYTQYSGWQSYFFVLNGEPWLSMFYGESYGCDDLTYVWATLGVGPQIMNWERMNIADNWYCVAGWAYYYTLINMANNVLDVIDECPIENEREAAHRDYIKASCLTVRAHAYVRLLQIYAPRWEDSNNGECTSVVLRLHAGYESLPLAPYNEVKKQLYADLDEALDLYLGSVSLYTRSAIYEPDEDIARGVYARLAMIVHDYPTAQKMAHDARQNYPIMTAEEYADGFYQANAEWMWANPLDNYVYYQAHGSVFACNGAYPLQWGNTGAGAMNLDLYREIPKDDIRRTLYIMPDQLTARTVKESTFWTNASFVDEGDMNINTAGINSTVAQKLNNILDSRRPAGLPGSAPKAYSFGGSINGITIPMGAQTKFWATDQFGTNQFPYMRAAEMLLTEAEAACHNNDEGTARNCLKELNTKRGQASYSTSATGQDLLDEVRTYRRIELWGEGHCWYDFKRWNVPMERRAFVFDDPDSNNYPIDFEFFAPTDFRNGWCFAIPRNETQFNDMIDNNYTNGMQTKGSIGK